MIDKIDGLGPIRTSQPVKRAAKAESSGSPSFARHLDEDGDISSNSGVASASGINSILGVQEVDDALAHASKGKRRALDILDMLDDLRVQLLSGGLSRDKLLQLSRMVAARRAVIKDPKLSALLDEVDLRAQVELAKYAP